MLNNTATNAVSNNAASSLQSSLTSVSSETSDDELLQVCKDFESYFIEEVMKEVKENMTLEDEDEDSSLSTLKDFYMDQCIELVADEVLDETGNSFTQQLYEQMKRNYNIE
jgi:flagellar protein FlgJ